jgi:hypothetical protein
LSSRFHPAADDVKCSLKNMSRIAVAVLLLALVGCATDVPKDKPQDTASLEGAQHEAGTMDRTFGPP